MELIRAGNLQHIASTTINSDQHSLEEEGLDDVSFDFEPPPPKIRSFSEAIHSFKSFLDAKGYSEQATVISSVLDMVASLNFSSLASGRQCTLDEYFKI